MHIQGQKPHEAFQRSGLLGLKPAEFPADLSFVQHNALVSYTNTARRDRTPIRKARWLVCTLTMLSLLVAPPTGATDALAETATTNLMGLSLEQLLEVNVDKVYGASKHEQQVREAPSSVSLVTRNDIQKQGYRTLADALQSLNGIFVTDDRNYSYLGIRGFNRPGDYNSRVLLLVDGHRLNDNIYGQGLYGTEAFLDIETVERVEVIRGPSSSIYGDNAFFGVVNVITRRGRSLDGVVEAMAEAGDNDTYKAGLAYGKQFTNGVELFLSGSFYDTAGDGRIFFPEFNSPTNNNGVAENSDADRAYHFFGSVGYHDWTLSGGWSWRQKQIPTGSFETMFNDGGERTTDERAYVNLKCDHEFSEDLRVIGRVAYDQSYYLGEYPYGSPPACVLNQDDATGEWFSTDWQLNWRVAGRHTLIFGGDYREHLTIHQGNFDDVPRAVHLDDERGGQNFGFFAQAELSLRTNLLFNGGVRFDHYSTFGESVNPRLALIYHPWTETTIKLLYGEAFRAPNAFELYYSYPDQQKANPELQPETIRTYELVFEQGLPANLRFNAAGYYYEVCNLVSQVIDPADNLAVFQNIDRVAAEGIELGLEKRCDNGLVARVSYAIQRTEDPMTDAELSNSPEHIAKLNLIAPLWADKLFAGVDLQYFSGVKTVTGKQTDGLFLANATFFSHRLVKNLEISASVYNLFDERDGFSASNEHQNSNGIQLDTIPLPGRSFRVKLTYHF